ncbi:DUF7373 family lipoprotein [Nocardia asteroides]|uniref:DUF7373 family lipoprotein n=1 Tax=Nocardia asteroides TaxID=1824 RepID=UPI00340C803B
MRIYYAAAAATLVITLGACGSEEIAQPPIDIAKLDTGNYPTTPLNIESLRTPSSGYVRESMRIGNITPIPHEYDGRFIWGPDYPRSQIITPQEPPYPDSFDISMDRNSFTTEFPGLVAGWRTHAARRFELNMGRVIETFTMRFDTRINAQTAAKKMFELAPGAPYSLADYPAANTKVISAAPYVTPKMLSWLVQDDFVIYARIIDPVSRPFRPDDNSEIVKKFYASQIARLKEFARTPLDKIEQLPLDEEGLLSRTLPADTPSSRATIYPAHVALSVSRTPVAAAAAYADAGVDLVVLTGAFVYRAKDAAAAERLSAAFGSEALSPGRATPMAEPPPNLPIATCNTGDAERSLPPTCRFTVGRHLVRVAGPNLQDLYQRATAQYRLLAG